jgi:factor associated with neutral sphingomyelinase activation
LPFDTSRLVEFSERLVWEGPALQLTPLMREPGRLAVTDSRVYFQPLHNIAGGRTVARVCVCACVCRACMHACVRACVLGWHRPACACPCPHQHAPSRSHIQTGDTPVRSHPLAAVAAVARRRSSLRPVGLELFMLSPSGLVDVTQQQQQQQEQLGGLAGPFWDAPSAFFTFRCVWSLGRGVAVRVRVRV